MMMNLKLLQKRDTIVDGAEIVKAKSRRQKLNIRDKRVTSCR
jgi:hypothetical protein